MFIVYRLSKSKYSKDLSGKGAELSGGRWNSKGTAMIYTSASRALAVSEIAVHTALGNLPLDYRLLSIQLPGASITEIDTPALPKVWNVFPYLRLTQELGDRFINENKYLILKAPSAVIPDEYNYLINPKHRDINRLSIIKDEVFEFDKRLFIPL